MRPTRRWWVIAGVGVVLLAVAVIGGRPLPLVGAASLGAFCLVSAVRSATTFTTTAKRLSADVHASPDQIAANGDTSLSITASLESPASHPITVESTFPPGVGGRSPTLRISPGETRTREFASPTFSVAGRFSLPDLECTFESPDGLFTQRCPIDDQVTVTVESRGTGAIHVGTGGERIPGGIGAHRGQQAAPIGEFSSIRQYVPGDPASRIDWKATARLDEPYIREYDDEREMETRLIVDARSRLATGEPGRTKLDFIRDVALSVLQSAREVNDPVALTVVDDDGIRLSTKSAATTEQYERVREELLRLGTETSHPGVRRDVRVRDETGPANAQAAYRDLTSRGEVSTEFSRTLLLFFGRIGSYVARLSDDPLFGAVRHQVSEASLGRWAVLLTDDEERGSLTEATKLAVRDGSRVTVFATPTVLFEGAGVVDLESAYERMIAFEEFRRRLDRLPRVAAFEVAPDERLRAVLAQGRDAKQRPQASEGGV